MMARGYAQDMEADRVDIRTLYDELVQPDERFVDEGVLILYDGNPGEVSVTAEIDDSGSENSFTESDLESDLDDFKIWLDGFKSSYLGIPPEEGIGPGIIIDISFPSKYVQGRFEWKVWEIDIPDEGQVHNWSEPPQWWPLF
jgi:hypothetical protein